MRHSRVIGLVWIAAMAAGCGSAPPPKPVTAPTVAVDQKMSWILRLEDKRILRDPAPPEPVAPPPPTPTTSKAKAKGTPPPPPPPPVIADLTRLASDADPRIRRRAALAI